MDSATVSSKYSIVIPKNVRERIALKPGQEVFIMEKDGVIHLIPLKPIQEMKGSLKGLDTSHIREETE